MNPAALLGMAAVGLGLFFLSGKSGGGGGSSEPNPDPNPHPHVDPLPHPQPTSDCTAAIQTIDQLEQEVLNELNADPADPARVCAAYNTYMMAVQAQQNGPCANEVPATSIPEEVAQQCSAPSNCQPLIAAVLHDAQVLIDLYAQDPTQQGDLCNAKAQLDKSVAALKAAGCTAQLPPDMPPDFECGGPPYIPPGTDCTAEFAAYQTASAALQEKLDAWHAGEAPAADACAAYHAFESASAELVKKGCEVPSTVDPSQYGDPCAQDCDALVLAVSVQNKFMSETGSSADCRAAYPAYERAFNAAKAAGCPLTGYAEPLGIDTQCADKTTPAGACAQILSLLSNYRDGQWSQVPETYCAQIRDFNAQVNRYASECGNPEGWALMDESVACNVPQPGANPQCAEIRKELEGYRDGTWAEDPAMLCMQIKSFNAAVNQYATTCGNNEGWTLLDETNACNPPVVSGWRGWY